MNQMSKMNQAIFAAVARMLRPLVRILLRNGIPYGVFADLCFGDVWYGVEETLDAALDACDDFEEN